ncbi:SAM-dependent methyltransferase [Yoonia sediminilitoris]|uniref:Cyclopropane-fatty-acyl-phospholipid synthase n=1 Tax=Yoonia sediminilitoris TaxID=1286148 RepID=A0A2T6KBY7_9RHOB|nr:cyclopropane-fatty-acyl-phospholipid synthase family protein [Yoonia sediminilitoris]PUB12430.1 cyclopropane-fatty-acyl-phospholipid synthase [Yoonia sediminilitoris]RCW93124.1 cyclopropane-fatty-acyl-phospholipid synthase [Yoonia sediminilitoris]
MTWVWQNLLHRMLDHLIQEGCLYVVMPTGDVCRYGDPGCDQPVTVRLHTPATPRQLVLNPELALGEAYMNGSLTIDADDLQGLLATVVRNARKSDAKRTRWQKLSQHARDALRGLAQNNIITRSRRNVAHHYDLSGRLFDLFLDSDRQYSCGYFREPDATLDQAQSDKKTHIARKLMLEPGMSVLDIGCGWGGMALSLAKTHGAHVVGITLSEEQQAYATKRAAQDGLSDRVQFRLCDYRQIAGTFDRIVSVGMFEHVGLPHFDDYFATIHDRLSPDGVALVHTIGWAAPAKATNPWIGKYIFPGGYIPSVSEVMTAVEKKRLWAADIECWRLHYAYTLRHWYERFNAHEHAARALYDDRFVRMWRFYLAASEQTFRHAPQAVYQFQLTRSVDAVPLARDYMYPHAGMPAVDRPRPVLVSDREQGTS